MWRTMVMSKSTEDFTVVICAGCVWESPVGPLRSHQRSLWGQWWSQEPGMDADEPGLGSAPSPAQLHVRCEPIVQMRKRRHRELD